MKQLFELGQEKSRGLLGQGPVKFAWQPSGNMIACVGEGQRNIFVFDRTGSNVFCEIPL